MALSTKHAFYVLAAPSAEVRDAWVNAMWQAAIPRSDLVQHLNVREGAGWGGGREGLHMGGGG